MTAMQAVHDYSVPSLPREADPAESGALSALAQQGFRETFHHYDPPALNDFLAREYGPETFAREMAERTNRFWVIEEEGQLIGYAKLGRFKLPVAPVSACTAELHRLYVLKAWHGRGLGRMLLEAAEAQARRNGADGIYLGVWSGNINAQRFYLRHGYEKAGEYDYPPIGDIVDREWIMKKAL